MEIIVNNPYRVAGILSNTTARELQRQKAKIKAYSKVGKEIISEFDFDFIESITRTEESTNKAFSAIQQNPDKVSNSLFWFLNVSPFDNTAIEYLKKGNPEKAAEIWDKVTQDKDVTSKNFSAFNNLGTYKLLSKSEDEIKTGIEAKIKLIESDNFKDFVYAVADETSTIDNQKQIEKLVDELLAQFKNQYSSSETLALFSNCNGSTQKYLSKRFTEEPIYNIESQIENTKNKRKTNKIGAYEFGLKLFTNSKNDLSLLKSLLGENDLKYKSLADQLANEIMQCGIDYFKAWQDTKDPSAEGLKLLKYAKSIAVGSQTKDRVKENIEGIEDWAETAPIKKEFEFIMKKIMNFKSLNDSVDNARSLVISCKPKLQSMKNTLGVNDEKYLNISSSVANQALGMLISVINEKQNDGSLIPFASMDLENAIRESLTVSLEIQELDMKNEQRSHFEKNHSTLKSIAYKLDIRTAEEIHNERKRTFYSYAIVSAIIAVIALTIWHIWGLDSLISVGQIVGAISIFFFIKHYTGH